jgi:23S rRNA G2445 N2-methylase RlmL
MTFFHLFQVSVHLNRDYFVIAFPLRGGSLARRSYLHSPSLRSTTAWALSSLASIREGDVVLDPMCGSGKRARERARESEVAHLPIPSHLSLFFFLVGTTLVEGLMEAKMSNMSVSWIGADLNSDQIRLCRENISHAKLTPQIQVREGERQRKRERERETLRKET